MVDALAGMIGAHVIHRDLRPTNTLVAPETDAILLADFSLATTPEHSVSAEDVGLSVGDWAYMSPEQTGRMNRPVDYRTDCYSLWTDDAKNECAFDARRRSQGGVAGYQTLSAHRASFLTTLSAPQDHVAISEGCRAYTAV